MTTARHWYSRPIEIDDDYNSITYEFRSRIKFVDVVKNRIINRFKCISCTTHFCNSRRHIILAYYIGRYTLRRPSGAYNIFTSRMLCYMLNVFLLNVQGDCFITNYTILRKIEIYAINLFVFCVLNDSLARSFS